MPFKKGHKKVGGKKKGSQNVVTKDIKEAFKKLVEGNLDNMNLWLEQVAEKKPDEALKILLEMSKRFVPPISTVDHTNNGKDFAPPQIIIMPPDETEQ